jgi:hypothetical protein
MRVDGSRRILGLVVSAVAVLGYELVWSPAHRPATMGTQVYYEIVPPPPA